MPENASNALARLREQGQRDNPELKEQIMAATLATCGEVGYRQASVAAVLKRYGGYRLQFYEQFASLADCYAAAHATRLDRLCAEMLAAGAEPSSWRAGLRAALQRLAALALAEPLLARGMLVEVHVAGGPATEKRQEVLERLSHALDSARRETGSRHSPPPLTAPFMVSAIESAVARSLVQREPERFAQSVPELERLVCCAYFGQGLA